MSSNLTFGTRQSWPRNDRSALSCRLAAERQRLCLPASPSNRQVGRVAVVMASKLTAGCAVQAERMCVTLFRGFSRGSCRRSFATAARNVVQSLNASSFGVHRAPLAPLAAAVRASIERDSNPDTERLEELLGRVLLMFWIRRDAAALGPAPVLGG